MARKIRLRASVGRQNLTAQANKYEASYVQSVRAQFKRITDNYEKFLEELEAQSAELLLDALKPTYALSQKYVPVDTSTLKNSGFLQIDQRSKVPRVVMGYAKGGSPDYAVLVHERVDMYHEPPTRSKFLLAALEEDEANIEKRIVRGYKTMVGAV